MYFFKGNPVMKVRALGLVITVILCFGFLKCENVKQPDSSIPNIAVIGAGIGGATSAHFLRQLFSSEVKIDVYEKEHIGGRLSTATVGGRVYEIGGSALHPKNKYMVEFMKRLGLQKRHVFGIQLGQYDGKQYLVMEGDRPINSFGKLFHRYGNSISNWHTVIDEVLNRFLRVYDVQGQGFAFTTVEQLLKAAHPATVNLTRITARRYLLENELLPVFVNEIATGVIRICYGQNTDVNAFAGTISLAGAKAGLWGVRGGNEQVPQLLIRNANATVTDRKVTDITLMPDGKFQIVVEPALDKPKLYDMVIVTTPLIHKVSDIHFHGFPQPIVNFDGHYHNSVTTLVRGTVNTEYLNAENKEANLQEILTTVEHVLFNSLSRIYPVDLDEEWNQSSTVWKLVSQRLLSDEELDTVFSERNATVSKSWLAYPHYNPPEKLGPFVLHPGLFYTSSLEWAASAMEMSAIAGKNAALLAYYHWTADDTLVDSYVGLKDEL